MPNSSARGTPEDRAVVVVGVDGSAASDQALLFAAHEAQLRGAVLRIVACHDLAVTTYGGFDTGFEIGRLEDGMRVAAEALVRAAAGTVAASTAASPVVVQTVVSQGRPSQVMLDEADGAALLVVGARGACALARLMMGSTSTEVVHHARVPVAVVPCNDRSEDGEL